MDPLSTPPDDQAGSCPVSLSSLLRYLAIEIPDDEISDDDLEFVRTAMVDGFTYWIWRLIDVYGDQCYALVTLWPNGGTSIDYGPSRGMSPEEFVATTHNS